MPYNIEAILRMNAEAAERERQEAQISQENHIVQLPVDELVDFPAERHRFQPATGQRLADLEESIRVCGILNAIQVRKLPDGEYQIIAGHNRRTAARNIGYQTVPCIIKNFAGEDEAELAMIQDNMNNRELLPSERGWGYRRELEIRRKQGYRSDLTLPQCLGRSCRTNDTVGTCSQSGNKFHKDNTTDNSAQNARNPKTSERMGQEKNVSKNSIHRYIRLTYLIDPLLRLVDEKKIGLGIGEQLSYLGQRSQETVYHFCYASEKPHPLKDAQAKLLREIEADPDQIIDEDLLEELTAPKKKVRFRTLKLEMSTLRDYFPTGTPEEVVVQTIQTALAIYFDRKEES